MTETPEIPPTPPSRPRLRTAVYCVVLGVVAAILMFWELGADALFSDEALYALVVQNIRHSSQWFFVTPYPGFPYHQKPPLYFWLTASTYQLLGSGEFAVRAWSAAAGVGAVVLTVILGALLISPEVGAFAGLLLMLNRAFLLVHGARSGTFDALLTFLILAAVIAYWLGARRQLRWRNWILVGAFAGLASLTKPLAGVPILGLLALHALIAARPSRLKVRLLGPLIAMLVLLAVAGPWYFAQWRKFPTFVPEMFQQNLLERIAYGISDKQVRDWKFYIEQISKSSIPFFLSVPAILYGVIRCFGRPRRTEYILLTLAGTGWIVLFSLSASKAVHYIYPAFPMIAIMLVDGAAQLAGVIWKRSPSRTQIAISGLLITAFAFGYGRMLYYSIPADRSPHTPWEMNRLLQPAIKAGDARVVFCGFPEEFALWQINMNLRDVYYLKQMSNGAQSVSDIARLAPVLEEHKPTLLVLSRSIDLRALVDDSSLKHRTDERFVYLHQGYVVLGVDLDPLFRPAMTPAIANPFVQLAPPVVNVLRFELKPPMACPARFDVRLRLTNDTDARPVRYIFKFDNAGGTAAKTLEDQTTIPRNGVLEVSTAIPESLWNRQTANIVSLRLENAEPMQTQPVSSTLEDARLTMLPTIPPEMHPRR